ncbi:MAG: hypothetical protein D3904_16865, partial [Candidatus Electrothrix sp. EH2]|nr:hypothetical protein [Candidatus Electrothrix sp. EH2]
DKIVVYTNPVETQVVEWQQSFKDRKATYRVMTYQVKDAKASGTLFVEQGLLDKFLESAEKVESKNPFADTGDGYFVEVTGNFQYGQDSDKTLRFLVYHDKSYGPYQHRFMATTAFAKIGGKVAEIAGKAPTFGDIVQKIAEMGKAYIGDPLRDF